MSILADRNTKVITGGITGRTGQFHTRICREPPTTLNSVLKQAGLKKAD